MVGGSGPADRCHFTSVGEVRSVELRLPLAALAADHTTKHAVRLAWVCVVVAGSIATSYDNGTDPFQRRPHHHRRWIKMISRKDWEPNTTSNYSVVCSKHFVSSDFKENTKIRQLKKGAVPSVFAGYPSYIPAPTSSRASMSPTPVSHIAGREESIPKRTAAASSNSSAMVDAQSFAKRAFATQTEKTRTSSSGFVERRKWRAKEQALRLQISKLKETVDKYKEELRKLKEDCNVSTSLDVVAGAEQKNVRAVFLLDQITNYNSKTDMV
ncbi:hypothetical protein HPB47_009789 [Ixodes persulcatus]|uniref:Uncharacterized protein n=1 Tax=Ixodes persulcatus TaxID=34615 RepID=A0AC60P0W2_IXOPE|nr:hypothetical protein HPB47_009789 [Ixodes persulcatus]